MGCVLIKRKVVEAVRDAMPKLDSPFATGTVPGFDGRTFGADYRFFVWAQRLGFEIWGDASIETPHMMLMYLSRDMYDVLGHKEKNIDYLNDIATQSKEIHGMNDTVLQARKEQLELHLSEIEKQIENWTQKKLVTTGQLAENIAMQEDPNNPLPEGAKKIGNLPVFGSEEEVTAAQRPPKTGEIELPKFLNQKEQQNAFANRYGAIDGGDVEESRKKD